MPALNGCICGTAFVTCIESALPRAAVVVGAPDGVLAPRHVTARELRRVAVALVLDLRVRRDPGIGAPPGPREALRSRLPSMLTAL